MLVRELIVQRNRTNRVLIKKSNSLLSASWTPRNANGVVQSEYEGLRTIGINVLSPSLRLKAYEQGKLISVNPSPSAGED